MLTAMLSGLVEEICRGRVGAWKFVHAGACPSGLPLFCHFCEGRNPSPSEQSFVDAV